MLRDLADRFGVQIYLEPGEAVITGTAQLVTTVLDVVHNEVDVAVVDASIEAHMLDHLIYGTQSPCRRAVRRRRIRSRSPVARASPATCSGSSRSNEPLRVGDEVRFADAAGYTMVKTTWFNGLRMPSIVVRRLDGTVEVVREFGYDDFERSLS